MKKLSTNSGFTLVEVIVGIALMIFFVMMSISYSQSTSRNSRVSQSITTRDRILSGVRSVAGMPAALRSSVRASQGDGVTPQNRELNDCVSGASGNVCENDKEIPFTLYSPTIALDGGGNPLGLLPITAPLGSATPMRFDSFGVPCAEASDDCLINVYTSFRPRCPPSPLPAVAPATTDPAYLALFNPMATCTVAETITVTYWVQMDEAAHLANPTLAGFIAPMSGTIATSVKAIFNNDPR